jgi:hypothetical protein
MTLSGIISRVASLIVAAVYLCFAIFGGGSWYGAGASLLRVSIILVWPLAFIWFPEQIGSVTGYMGGGYVDAETPPFLIAFMGWFFLLGLPVIFALLLAR